MDFAAAERKCLSKFQKNWNLEESYEIREIGRRIFFFKGAKEETEVRLTIFRPRIKYRGE